MLGHARAFLGVALLVGGGLASAAWFAAAAGDEDACPPFERVRYNLTFTKDLAGDLKETQHVRGTVDMRHCVQVRDRVHEWRVRYHADGGAYDLKITLPDREDRHLLRAGANETAWYDAAFVTGVEYSGVSGRGEVSTTLVDSPVHGRFDAAAWQRVG